MSDTLPNILYVSKEEIAPNFGYWKPGEIKIRTDLPIPAKEFVLSHELYHDTDKETNWFLREVKANMYAAKKHPLGFVIVVVLSFAPYRLSYYYNRFKEGK